MKSIIRNFLAIVVSVHMVLFGSTGRSQPMDSAHSEITQSRFFPEALVWVGEQPPSEGESQLLLQALRSFQTNDMALAEVEAFLQANPNSGWAPSLHAVMAKYYRGRGRYTPALEHWEAAWNATKDAESGSAKEIADFTLAHWTRLLANLGRVETLRPLLNETRERTLDAGPLLQRFLATREGFGTMSAQSGVAYRCGTFALFNVGTALNPKSNPAELLKLDSPPSGFSLGELKRISDRIGLRLVPVRRATGEELVVPSVVHWKQNHYAAIVERKDDLYHVADPTFGHSHWLSGDAINSEASGAFMVLSDGVPSGWTLLRMEEADQIFGRGWPEGFDNDNPCSQCPCPPGNGGGGAGGGGSGGGSGSIGPRIPGCPTCGGGAGGGAGHGAGGDDECCENESPPPSGMPRWRISEPYINLWLEDEPLGYQPARGPRVSFRLAYNQRFNVGEQLVRDKDWFSVGKLWNASWLSFVQEESATFASMYAPDGGIRHYRTDGSAYIGIEYSSNSRMDRLTNGSGTLAGYRVRHRNGAIDVYDFLVNTGGVNTVFLTAKVTPAGHTNRFEYTKVGTVVRLVRAIDAQGQTNNVYYEATTNPYSTNLITRIADPFGRETRLQYSSAGHLTNVVDAIGMTNFFFYNSQGWITNMTTPYGPTRFDFTYAGDNLRPVETNNRTVLITEPNGAKQLYVFREESSWLPHEYPDQPPYDQLPPDAQRTANHNYRNSYYWNRQQFAALPVTAQTEVGNLTSNDFKLARLRHWFHPKGDTVVGNTLHIERQPSPTTNTLVEGQKTWYYYLGIHGLGFAGDTMRPSTIAQVPNNDLTQPTRYTWNRYEMDYSGQLTNQVNTYSKTDGTRGFRTNEFIYSTNLIDLLRTVDWSGKGTTNGYNANHQLVGETNALGYWTTYAYNANGQVSTVTRSSGLTTTYAYDSKGYATNITDVEIGRSESFSFGTNGLMQTHTDPLGLKMTNTWDKLQRLTSVSDANGYISNVYTRLDLTATRDKMGNWRYFTYNGIRQMTSETNELGKATIYEYCDCGALGSITDALGNMTQFFYDLNGRLTNAIYPGNLSVSHAYNLFGQVTNTTDNTGNSTTYSYNHQGLITNVANAFGRVQATAYDIEDSPTSITDGDGVTQTSSFDGLGRILSRSYADGGIESFQYSARGLIGYTNQLGNLTKSSYDAAGRKIAETNANNEVVQFKYDPAGNLTNLIDGKLQNTYWKHDQFGRVTNKLDDTGAEMFRYAYDANDRLLTRWTPAKSTTTYGYDAVGNQTSIVYAVSAPITLRYDALNRLTNMVDAMGATRYSYTAFGAVSSEDGPWENDTVIYGYNRQKRSTLTVQQPNGGPWAQNYSHDFMGRLETVTSAAGTFTYTYSGAGSLVKNLASPNGASITNSHDLVGRLTSTFLKNSTAGILSSNIYAYDLASRRTNHARSSNVWTRYTYDGADQLKTAWAYQNNSSPREHEKFGYRYDAAGNLQYRTNNALEQTFNVNSLNQLTTATRNTTLTAEGSHSGPATSVTVAINGGVASAATLWADNTFSKSGLTLANGTNTIVAVASDSLGRNDTNTSVAYLPATTPFAYDANGNLTYDGIKSMEYDDENQLIRLTGTNHWKSEFSYDGKFRRRVRKEFTWQNNAWVLTNEVRYVYDGNLEVQWRDSFNLPTLTLTRGTDLSGTLEGAGGIGGLLARTDHSSPVTSHAYFHSDVNGNVIALIDTNRNIVAQYAYEPFGRIFSMSGPQAEANLYRFNSKELHIPSGLVSYLRRYYDPNLQRWINRDPIGEGGSINLYQFVFNRPNDAVDPFGLAQYVDIEDCFDDCWAKAKKKGMDAAKDALLNNAPSLLVDLAFVAGGLALATKSPPAGTALAGIGALMGAKDVGDIFEETNDANRRIRNEFGSCLFKCACQFRNNPDAEELANQYLDEHPIRVK